MDFILAKKPCCFPWQDSFISIAEIKVEMNSDQKWESTGGTASIEFNCIISIWISNLSLFDIEFY